MSKRLEDIGFYPFLTSGTAKTPLMRCELILTDACNFRCPYCRGLRDDLKRDHAP